MMNHFALAILVVMLAGCALLKSKCEPCASPEELLTEYSNEELCHVVPGDDVLRCYKVIKLKDRPLTNAPSPE